MASVRKGGTARHSPFARKCEGRFFRAGNEPCRDLQDTRKEACFRQRVPVKTDRAKPATETKRSKIEVAHGRLRTADYITTHRRIL